MSACRESGSGRLLREVGGLEVIAECSNGVEAIRTLHRAPADVVFLDVPMPGLDGFEVIQSVGLARLPCVIFATAFERHLSATLDERFLRIHRTTILRIDCVAELRASTAGEMHVTLRNGDALPVNRRNVARLRRALAHPSASR